MPEYLGRAAAVAMYEFVAAEANEVNLAPGNRVVVLFSSMQCHEVPTRPCNHAECFCGWMIGWVGDEVGGFPANYVDDGGAKPGGGYE